MEAYHPFLTPRTYRRVSAQAIARLAATPGQAARFAALGAPGEPRHAPAPLWDNTLMDRLVRPISRLHE